MSCFEGKMQASPDAVGISVWEMVGKAYSLLEIERPVFSFPRYRDREK